MFNWTLAEEEAQLRLDEALKLFSPERMIIEEILREQRRPSLRERISAALTGRGSSVPMETKERYVEEVVAEAGDLLGSRYVVWNRPHRQTNRGDY